MNEIDYHNIRELIYYRINVPKYETGGSLSIEEIESKSTEELRKLILEYTSLKQSEAIKEIKSLVDEIFQEYSEESDNIIVLSAAKYSDDSRCVYEMDDPLESINFGGFENKYNPFYYPIARNWKRRNWRDPESKDDDRLDVYWDYIEELCTKLQYPESMFEFAEDYYRDNNDALNEFWCGVIGITKDYKLVSFVIRDDGMLCTEDSMESGYNKIIAQL